MPVYKLKEEMPYDEFLKWIEFFKYEPIGWREDYRTHLIMSSFGYKGKAESTFQTLKQIKQYSESRLEGDRAMPKGKILEMMMNAKNGDDSGWTPKGLK